MALLETAILRGRWKAWNLSVAQTLTKSNGPENRRRSRDRRERPLSFSAAMGTVSRRPAGIPGSSAAAGEGAYTAIVARCDGSIARALKEGDMHDTRLALGHRRPHAERPTGRRSPLYVAVCAALGSVGVAHGQSIDAGAGPIEEVVITGSRIVRRDFNAPSPIVKIGRASCRERGSNWGGGGPRKTTGRAASG